MTARDLEAFFHYGYWANAKLFEAVSQLSAEQFTQPVSGSYGSIRNTLVHMMSTEWGWMERSGGFKRGPKLNASDFPTFTSVIERWTQVEMHVRGFLARLRDEDLNRVVEFAIGDGPKHTLSVGQMMHHAAVHGVHHRGQVALLLRSLGCVPGDFDLFFYYTRPSVSLSDREQLFAALRNVVFARGDSRARLGTVAALLRKSGSYRWVGLYSVDHERAQVCIVDWSGPSAPEYPTLPITKGLTGAAIAARKTVNIGEVAADPRYLTTFGTTRSEIIVPVFDAQRENVIGTIDIESELPDAFGPEVQTILEECAGVIRPLWNAEKQPRKRGPVFIQPGEGQNFSNLTCRISSDSTGGECCAFEFVTKPSEGVALHTHAREDEIYYILEGELEIQCQGTRSVQAGAMAVLPRGIPHAFRNTGSAAARVLTIFVPGGFDRFVEELSRMPASDAADEQKRNAIREKHGIRML